MKKLVLFVSICLLSVYLQINAQSVEAMQSAYAKFVQLNNGGADKAQLYGALYDASKASMATANSVATGSQTYYQALNVMKSLAPYLPNAAAFYQQQRVQNNAVLCASTFVDIALMEGMGTQFITHQSYAQLSYFAASYYFNSKSYAKSTVYMNAYLKSVDTKYRETVYECLSSAYISLKDYPSAFRVLDEGVSKYPSNYKLLGMAINACNDSGDKTHMQAYLDKALLLRPDDKTLILNQANLYEESNQFDKALALYQKLQQTNPNDITVARHLALNYYNIGVLNYNASLVNQNKSDAERQRRMSKEYFSSSITHLNNVLGYDPTSSKYTQALAVAYKCTDNKAQFEQTNNKLASLGGGRIPDSYVPELISYSNNSQQLAADQQSAYQAPQQSYNRPQSSTVSNQTSGSSQQTSQTAEVPPFSVYAKEYIESVVNEWQQKDPYETVSEYRERVTEQTRNEKIAEAKKKAEQNYISQYAAPITHRDVELKPYDAENGVFLVESRYGQMVLPVPRANNEARVFETGWSGVQFKAPVYCISNDGLALAALTFVTPTGKSYQYDNSAALAYTDISVDVNFDAIDASLIAASNSSVPQQQIKRQTVNVGSSDVDTDIPQAKESQENTFAVIIANENYLNVAKVPNALQDGIVFSKYCEKTLGIPHNNVRLYKDASYGMMLRAIRDVGDIASAYNGDINVIFYYAGHGIPNESTRESYLLPIDADGQQTEGCYMLSKLYAELGKTNAHQILVFLDACFSGAQRGDGMLASARGIALKPKQEDPNGNMVVFSAASNDETAFPYNDKGHGLFTYFLLKKIQETKGNVTLGDLGNYITEQVKRQSVVINRKAQTPVVAPSESMAATWASIKLK